MDSSKIYKTPISPEPICVAKRILSFSSRNVPNFSLLLNKTSLHSLRTQAFAQFP